MDPKQCPTCGSDMEPVNISSFDCPACGHHIRGRKLAGDVVEDFDLARIAEGERQPLDEYIVIHYERQIAELESQLQTMTLELMEAYQ